MKNIEHYPYYDRLLSDLELLNIYLGEDGLEVLSYGETIMLCKYITGKQRVRVREYRTVNIVHNRTGESYVALEINFFAGPLVYLVYNTELEIFNRDEITKSRKNETFA